MVPGSHRWGDQIAELRRMNELDEAAGVSADDAAFRRFPDFKPVRYEGYTVPARLADVVGTHRPVRRGEVHGGFG